MGATVIGLTSADRVDWLTEHGIVAVVYGDGQDACIRTAAGASIDAFIDTFGSGYIDLALALGVAKDRINTVVDFKGAQANGATTLGTKQAGGLPALQELAELAASGALDIPIAKSYALADVQDAYRYVATRKAHGKVVLHPME